MFSITLLESTTLQVNVSGDKQKGAGYSNTIGCNHTVSIATINLIGRVFIEGSLASDPSEADWFPIQLIPGQDYIQFPADPRAPTGASGGDSSVVAYNFSGNYIWIRARLNRDYLVPYPMDTSFVGAIKYVLLTYGSVSPAATPVIIGSNNGSITPGPPGPQGPTGADSVTTGPTGASGVGPTGPLGTGPTGPQSINSVNASNITITSVTSNAAFYPAFVSATSGNIGAYVDSGFTYNPGNHAIVSTGNLSIWTNSLPRISIDTSGNVGIGQTTPLAGLHLPAGTASTASLIIPPATALNTNLISGSVENDGNVMYLTTDTVTGRGYIPSMQIYRMTSNATASGTGVTTPYFGANSNVTVVRNSIYEFEFNLWFAKATNGTATFHLKYNNSPIYVNTEFVGGPVAGIQSSGTSISGGITAAQGTLISLPATASLSNNTFQYFKVFGIMETNLTVDSTFTLFFTANTGTITPQKDSYFKLTQLPFGNIGIFS